MPRLKNANHEKVARIYAEESLQSGGKVVKTNVYQRVYKGSSYDSARTSAPQLFAKPAVQARIQEIISKRNSEDDISEDLALLRRATKDHVTNTGAIIEVRDNTTRLGAVQTVLKVMGAFQPEAIPQDNRQVIFNLNGQDSNQSSNTSPQSSNGSASSNNDGALGFLGSLSNIVEKLGDLNRQLGIDGSSV